ncbi:MAG: ABC transporter substrate-binding protein [Methanomicrobiaceae archaeon]|nr:ABC transporter substrate-binding protein [Methanomicrobiaceae archaeon]
MNRKTLFVVLVCVCVLAAAFAGCTDTSEPDGGVPAATYVVGIDVPYPPFSMIDSQGNAIGFDVESMQWIAEDQGFEVKFQQVAWDGIIPALQAGNIDIIYSGMTITPERAEKVAFSDPYWVVNQDVVAKEGAEITLEQVLAGEAAIGTQRGCTAAMWVEENLIATGMMDEEDLRTYDNTPLAVDDMMSGRIDVVMYDDLVLKDIVAGKAVTAIGFVETREEFGIAVRKDDTELLAQINAGLANLQADPAWEELQDKYGMR